MGIGQHFLSRLNYVIWWFHASTTLIDYINIFCAKSNSQCIASGNGQWFLFLQKQSGKLFLYLNLRHTDILTPRVKNLWDTRCVSFVEYTQRGTESTQATQTQWRFGTVAVNLVRARIRCLPRSRFCLVTQRSSPTNGCSHSKQLFLFRFELVRAIFLLPFFFFWNRFAPNYPFTCRPSKACILLNNAGGAKLPPRKPLIE